MTKKKKNNRSSVEPIKRSLKVHHRHGFVWFAPSIDYNVTIPVAISSDIHHRLLCLH